MPDLNRDFAFESFKSFKDVFSEGIIKDSVIWEIKKIFHQKLLSLKNKIIFFYEHLNGTFKF